MVIYLLRQLKGWWKVSSTSSKIMNIIQKKFKGDNSLDYSFNTIDRFYKNINNKLDSLRSSNLAEFRWDRDTYSAILDFL